MKDKRFKSEIAQQKLSDFVRAPSVHQALHAGLP